MYIARYTSSVYAVLIEIESPCKRWFTTKGQPDSKLTQAVNQLRQWKRWFEQPGSKEKFLDEYEVPVHFSSRPRFQQRYFLIYGRRGELQDSGYADQRSHHEQFDERFISYDHLSPDSNLRDALTVKVDGQGYRAIVIPPTIRLGPFTASDHVAIRRKEDVADQHPMMSPVRGSFLKERWCYWDHWASSSGSGLANSQDWE